jgi:hypothetical protein
MDIRNGDAVFLRNGEPGIVKDRSQATGKLTVDTDNETVKRDMRHGYLNGLTDTQRAELNTILDSVKTNTEDPTERISALETKVRELESDPRQIGLSKYVKAEMVHMMNSHGIKPREYTVQEIKVR